LTCDGIAPRQVPFSLGVLFVSVFSAYSHVELVNTAMTSS
jgi:hypothetical protein